MSKTYWDSSQRKAHLESPLDLYKEIQPHQFANHQCQDSELLNVETQKKEEKETPSRTTSRLLLAHPTCR